MPKIHITPTQRFGRLVTLDRVEGDRWRFHCDCGTETVALAANVTRGRTTSCGCFAREVSAIRRTSHGHTSRLAHPKGRSKTYAAWTGMRDRCLNPRTKQYADYGGRGIEVCLRWYWFENFLADMGEAPPGLVLNRLDTDGDYEAANCQWTTRAQQSRKARRTKLTEVDAALIRQDPRPGVEIARAFGISPSGVCRIRGGALWR